ncbi:MAG: DUF2071 domain-containing protein [Gemmatimonadota bacterium]
MIITRARRPLLRGRWANLLLLNYDAPPGLVERCLPPGVEPDLWQGQPQVSLAAFELLDLRLRGRRVPGYVNFPVVALRTYGRLAGERGLVSIRACVPSRVVAALGRLRFREPFVATPLTSRVAGMADALVTEYRWRWEGEPHLLRVTGTQTSAAPSPGCLGEHFLTPAWGFVVGRSGDTEAYRIEHAVSAVREVRSLERRVRFAQLYGDDWRFLDEQPPHSAVFAVGAPVKVYPPRPIRRSARP